MSDNRRIFMTYIIIQDWLVEVGRYRYLWPNILAISRHFTAALFGLLTYFIITHKESMLFLNFRFELVENKRCNDEV